MNSAAEINVRNLRCINPLKSSLSSGVGKLYRSGYLDDADEETVAKVKDQLQVKTIIDLRLPRDYLSSGTDAVKSTYKRLTYSDYTLAKEQEASDSNAQGRYHVFIPMLNPKYVIGILRRLPYSMYPSIASWLFRIIVLKDRSAIQQIGQAAVQPFGLAEQYLDFLRFGQDVVLNILTVLSQPTNVPAIICCQHGKDRTGVVCALILHILGHSTDEIADDYNASEAQLVDIKEEVIDELRIGFGLDESFAPAPREVMVEVLQKTEKEYGSIDNYLTAAGVTQELRDRLRQVFQPAVSNATPIQPK